MAESAPAYKTPREKALALRQWATAALAEAEKLHSLGKMRLIEELAEGSYNGWRRIENGTWVVRDDTGKWVIAKGGKPQQDNIEKYINAWFSGARRQEHRVAVARIMDFTIVEAEAPAPIETSALTGVQTPNQREVNRLMAASDEMVSPRRKRLIDRQLGNIIANDRAEAVEEGWPVLGDDSGLSNEDTAG